MSTPRLSRRPNSERAEKLDLDAISAFADRLSRERDSYSLAAAAYLRDLVTEVREVAEDIESPASLDATLAQDPVTVAARVVRDLWTLSRMAIEEGREAEATTIAVTSRTMQSMLDAANARVRAAVAKEPPQ